MRLNASDKDFTGLHVKPTQTENLFPFLKIWDESRVTIIALPLYRNRAVYFADFLPKSLCNN